ncbi:MAG: hypothetical protein KTR30_05550 [Saprospiraceae bacterium]|nr:hypothetical protein [Saprospiraceae bacterium]
MFADHPLGAKRPFFADTFLLSLTVSSKWLADSALLQQENDTFLQQKQPPNRHSGLARMAGKQKNRQRLDLSIKKMVLSLCGFQE